MKKKLSPEGFVTEGQRWFAGQQKIIFPHFLSFYVQYKQTDYMHQRCSNTGRVQCSCLSGATWNWPPYKLNVLNIGTGYNCTQCTYSNANHPVGSRVGSWYIFIPRNLKLQAKHATMHNFLKLSRTVWEFFFCIILNPDETIYRHHWNCFIFVFVATS